MNLYMIIYILSNEESNYNNNNIDYNIHPKIGMFLKGEFLPRISPSPTVCKELPCFRYNPSPFIPFPE